MSETKLLTCPFCGVEVMLDREYIFCDNCKLLMRIDDRLYSGEALTYEEAVEQTIVAWNTRKPIEQALERLEVELTNATESRDRNLLKNNRMQFQIDLGYANGVAIAIEILKEIGLE